MSKFRDLTGEVFGRWVAESLHHVGYNGARWNCVCSRGTRAVVRGSALTNGRSSSCGCYRAEVTGDRSRTHGQSHQSLYNIWCNLHARCGNPNNEAYYRYGGRGIKVCRRWRIFANFASDMGPRPEGLELDRKNNNLGYSPKNCVWATPSENSRNKRTNVFVVYQGAKVTVAEAAELCGVHRYTLYARLKRGWTAPQLFESVK